MSAMTDAPSGAPVRFAPIPLVSGEAVGDEAVESVTVVIRTASGTIEVPLEQRHGGWWVPKDRLNG